MPGGPLGAPSRLYNPPGVETLKQEEFLSFSPATERKPTEKKKPSPAGRFRWGDHLLEGEIIAIVIIIVTGIIEIIMLWLGLCLNYYLIFADACKVCNHKSTLI